MILTVVDPFAALHRFIYKMAVLEHKLTLLDYNFILYTLIQFSYASVMSNNQNSSPIIELLPFDTNICVRKTYL